MMGLILVSGIIVRNAILLIDFAEDYLKKFGDIKAALVEAVRLRTRPVLMTAFATIAGLIPIALQKRWDWKGSPPSPGLLSVVYWWELS
jgi:multidrug efflux pump subunit AcrB